VSSITFQYISIYVQHNQNPLPPSYQKRPTREPTHSTSPLSHLFRNPFSPTSKALYRSTPQSPPLRSFARGDKPPSPMPIPVRSRNAPACRHLASAIDEIAIVPYPHISPHATIREFRVDGMDRLITWLMMLLTCVACRVIVYEGRPLRVAYVSWVWYIRMWMSMERFVTQDHVKRVKCLYFPHNRCSEHT
jgi:hypothetical protein